jgi:CRP-like cAMP-binding protein
MAIDPRIAPFLAVPLFKGLKPLQITEIARRAQRIVFKPGSVIIANGAPADGAVLIVGGEAVRTEAPGGQTEERVPVGALLGEMALLIETEHTSTVVARTPVRALRIARDDMLAQMTDDPSIAEHFIAKLSGRLTAFVNDLRRIDRSLEATGTPRSADAGEGSTRAAAEG